MGNHGQERKEAGSWSKVRKMEKVGKKIAGCDHTISCGEEIPWVSQKEITPLPGRHMEERIYPLQDKRTAWEPLRGAEQQGQRGIQRAENLLTFQCEPQ